MRTIQIGEKELGLRATPLALLYYQQEFDKDLMADLVSMEEMVDKFEDEDYSRFDSVKILQLCYAMNKADNFGESFPDFEKWLSELGSINLVDGSFIVEVIEEAFDGFFRSGETGSKPEQKTK
ncbi:MAG: phage-like protein [Candidatus Frackibacter sp. T328-2]|nr:MAG: phage-like protein [Candidatus Frackibacter sp. T328-2]